MIPAPSSPTNLRCNGGVGPSFSNRHGANPLTPSLTHALTHSPSQQPNEMKNTTHYAYHYECLFSFPL